LSRKLERKKVRITVGMLDCGISGFEFGTDFLFSDSPRFACLLSRAGMQKRWENRAKFKS